MLRYKVDIKEPSITLSITSGRSRIFKKDEEVDEDGYTKMFPQYFKRVGEVKGLNMPLTTPVFIKDSITEFVGKEESRRIHSKKYINYTEEESFDMRDEITEAIAEHLEEKYNIEVTKENLSEIIEDFEVRIETEE